MSVMKKFITFLILLKVAEMSHAQEWFIELPYEGESSSFFVGAMSGDYNYSFGSVHDLSDYFNKPLALCADNNAEYIHKVFDHGNNSVFISSAIGLGDGNVFVLANCRNEFDMNIREKLWIAVINPELDIVYQNFIMLTDPYMSFGSSNLATLNENDEIVVVAQITEDCNASIVYHDYAFYKIDKQCNVIYSSYLENKSRNNEIYDVAQIPGTNIYTVFGMGMEPLGGASVFYIDDEFNFLSSSLIDNMNYYPYMILPYFMNVHWLNEDIFMMSAISPQDNAYGDWKPMVYKMDKDMNILNSISFERIDTSDYVTQYGNMIYHNSNTIYVSTFWNHANVYHSNEVHIYLINEELEKLGELVLETGEYISLTSIQTAEDEGCIVNGHIDYGSYRVAVSWKFDRKDFVDNTSLTEKDVRLEIKSYPNPVTSCLNFDIEKILDDNVIIEIIDMNGKVLSVHDVYVSDNHISIDLSYLNDGIYYYRLFADNRYICSDTFIKN